ncbi:hypothetical protein [Methanoregula sp. UBA64]|uniref:hypothetical protein n=1 Tax=Methanoregula sp. UBA64 TaxID=1915554 RepID=UPI0025DB6718|nr:hypothetical protein [Methanoregula sp. UBA64]
MGDPDTRKVMKIGFLILAMLFFSVPVPAMSGTGTKYVGSIAPGGTDTFRMSFGIGPNEDPSDISVQVMGFGQSMDTGFVPVDPANDTNPYSARTFISLDNTTIHLKPGMTQQVTATITLPKNVGPGGRYAIIYVHSIPAAGGQATIATAVVIPVLITVSETQPSLTGSIENVNVGDLTAGQPVIVTTTFRNTGNYHYRYTINSVTVTDSNKNILATGTTQPSENSVIPGNTVQYIVQPEVKNLPEGTYTVDSKVLRENGQVLDEKASIFSVKSNYVPPVTESSITLTPGSAGTLTSPDGRYSISFPQGAMLGDAVVTLKPYSHDKLPSAPTDAGLGATCFEITGLSGLLSKDATVTVTYSADDLTGAGGDTSKLKLSYYDAAQNAWVILPTQVDAGKTTLTTTTNHLSVWAVMISSSTTGSATSGSTPGTAATQSPLSLTVIIISLIIAGIMVKRSIRKQE